MELWRQRTTQTVIAKVERLYLRAFEGRRETVSERGERLVGHPPPSAILPAGLVTRPPSTEEVERAAQGQRRSELLELIRSGATFGRRRRARGRRFV